MENLKKFTSSLLFKKVVIAIITVLILVIGFWASGFNFDKRGDTLQYFYIFTVFSILLTQMIFQVYMAFNSSEYSKRDKSCVPVLDDLQLDESFLKVRKKPITVHAKQIDHEFAVHTMEGLLYGKKNDYIIVGHKGEKYPIDKTVFEETYDIIKKKL